MRKILTKDEALKLTGEHIVIPEGFSAIGEKAFAGRDMISINIPGSVKTIGDCAFAKCNKLKSVTINFGVERIGTCAFSSCTELESITMPDSLKVIDESAFICCRKLKSVILPQGLVSIGNAAFDATALENITIPASVKYMYRIWGQKEDDIEPEFAIKGNFADSFGSCYKLTDINVDPENETFASIDGVLFTKDKTVLLKYPAGKQQEVYAIPDGVKVINYASFAGCNLESFVIPDSVSIIDTYAFMHCEKLVNITIPKSVEHIDSSAFEECENLTDILVDEDNAAFSSIDGLLVNKDKTVLLKYPEGRLKEPIIIPASITGVGYDDIIYRKSDGSDKEVIEILLHALVMKHITIENRRLFNMVVKEEIDTLDPAALFSRGASDGEFTIEIGIIAYVLKNAESVEGLSADIREALYRWLGYHIFPSDDEYKQLAQRLIKRRMNI